MIGEYTLKILCDKYNISSDKIVNKNNNILTYGEYIDIDKTLDYLINKLNISGSNIEKCPSILYRNVVEIEKNVSFLRQQKISFSSIENCLHVLSTNSEDLVETYKYIEENYGVSALNKNTSALSCNKELIIEVEKLNLNKDWNLTIAVSIEFDYTTIENVKVMINSVEYKEYPELFTSQTLAKSNIERIQDIINSKEFKEHRELFTSETLAHSNIEKIQEIINSEEFKKYPELFTSETLAHAKIEDIQKIIKSEEFKEHRDLFTSTTLAHAKIEDISELLKMPYWKDDRYKKLLTSSIVSKSKQMLKKLPILFKMAEQYQIENYINTSFLLFSPSQNYALINYLLDNNLPLVIDNKLNTIFGKQPNVLKKKYKIDLKELMNKYHYEENIGGIKRNGIR